MKAYFVSDIHLKSDQEKNAKIFLDLLLKIQNENATDLFLVGDIFDLWIGNKKYFIQKFDSIVKAIQSLVQSGVQVHYFEGNHDLYLKSFWENKIGVKFYSKANYFKLNFFKVIVGHGD